MSQSRLFDRIDGRAELVDLHRREVNYSTADVDPGWNHDSHRFTLPREGPGPPEEGGSWALARSIVEAYEFCVPELIHAAYDSRDELLGRNMLLEGRFLVLRYYLGVRITGVVDEAREGSQRVWGWNYRTLQGHLEQGQMGYEVVKHEETGEVEFVITAYSSGSPGLGPITRLGWRVFGRRTQLRFYRRCGQRVRQQVSLLRAGGTLASLTTPDGYVLIPGDAPRRRRDRLSLRHRQPG